jgi:hypothetical protein
VFYRGSALHLRSIMLERGSPRSRDIELRQKESARGKALCPCCGRREGVPVAVNRNRKEDAADLEYCGKPIDGGSMLLANCYEAYVNRQCLKCEFTWRETDNDWM